MRDLSQRREFTETMHREWLQKPFLERSMVVLLNIRAKIPHFTPILAHYSRHLPPSPKKVVIAVNVRRNSLQ